MPATRRSGRTPVKATRFDPEEERAKPQLASTAKKPAKKATRMPPTPVRCCSPLARQLLL